MELEYKFSNKYIPFKYGKASFISRRYLKFVLLLIFFIILIPAKFVKANETQTIIGSSKDNDSNNQTFNIKKIDDTYYLNDTKRKIRIFDFNNLSILFNNDEIFSSELIDKFVISSKDKDNWPKEAVTVFKSIEIAYDYYDQVLGLERTSIKDNYINIILNYPTGVIKSPIEAIAFNDKNFIAIAPKYTKEYNFSNMIEVLGHELTHKVMNNIVNLYYSYQINITTCIQENYCVAFGLLINNYNKSISLNKSFKGANGYNNFKTDADIKYIAQNDKYYNDIIGNCIYLMNIKGIKDDIKLAKLMYQALFELRNGEYTDKSMELTWENLRWAFESASNTLKMSTIEKEAIKLAFNKVNILESKPPSPYSISIDEKLDKAIIFGYNNFMKNKISIPSTIEGLPIAIGDYSFEGCENLEEVIIEKGVSSIGYASFADCKNLKKVTIPSTVSAIGDYSFKGCENLEEVIIEEGVRSMGYASFADCKNLKKVTIPSTIYTIGDHSFNNCDNVILKCIKSSYSEKYSIKNRIKFEY